MNDKLNKAKKEEKSEDSVDIVEYKSLFQLKLHQLSPLVPLHVFLKIALLGIAKGKKLKAATGCSLQEYS